MGKRENPARSPLISLPELTDFTLLGFGPFWWQPNSLDFYGLSTEEVNPKEELLKPFGGLSMFKQVSIVFPLMGFGGTEIIYHVFI